VALASPLSQSSDGGIVWLPENSEVAGQIALPSGIGRASDLYWANVGGRVALAKTPWPIARLSGTVRPDTTVVSDMVHSPLMPTNPCASPLLGINRLSTHERRLHQIEVSDSRDLTPERLLSELDERLRLAIQSRMPHDGPVAVLATGGLDSSLVAAIARDILGASPILIAIRGGLSSPTECDLQEKLARALSSKLIVLDEIPPFTLLPLIRLNHESDFPAGGVFTHVWDAALALAREAGAGVVLTGEGGNELFSPGLAAAADYFRAGRILAALTAAGRSRPSDGSSVAWSIRRGVRAGMFPDLREAGSSAYVAGWQGVYAASARRAYLRRRMQIRQLRRQGLSYAAIAAHVWLERTDLYAAQSSFVHINVSSPLAEDAALWSWMAAAPKPLLARTVVGQDKHLLRLIARRYLPPAITETRKVGVPNQIATILRTVGRDELHMIRAGADWLGLSLTSHYETPSELPADCGLAWTRMLAMSAWGMNALS
jgi:asparagine synthetase B (glutamine-hydrolysing)